MRPSYTLQPRNSIPSSLTPLRAEGGVGQQHRLAFSQLRRAQLDKLHQIFFDRDWMRHGKVNITQGKNFYRCGAVGRWLVTADEFSDGYDDLRVRTRVNGEVRQNGTTINILYDFSYLIAYAATRNALAPGDIISTGTPTRSGARLDPPQWLRASDTVEVEVSGVGVISNPIENEA